MWAKGGRRSGGPPLPFRKFSAIAVCFVLWSLCGVNQCSGSHLLGHFNPEHEFFRFVAKFGFQKTDRHSQRATFGYIYGNITSSSNNLPVNVTLAVLDKRFFEDFYGNRSIMNREIACQKMFAPLDRIAYHSQCNPQAKADYLRQIPCQKGKLCPDEDAPSNVIRGNQLTYVISDLTEPRFWYVAIVACYRDIVTCEWHHSDIQKQNLVSAPDIYYDLHLVNGNPNQSAYIPLTFQFSFDKQNTFEMYLIFFTVYLVLVPLQYYAMRRQKHPVTRLFTISLTMEFISLSLILVHMVRFAMNGIGNENFRVTGDIFDIFSRTSFMLILLLLAKGWAVTRQQISRTGWIILMSIWIPYSAFNVVLYVWNLTDEDIISDLDEYQSWPGWIVLVCRSMIMLWFLWELRNTMKYEHSSKKLDFLLHFGASSLVWFIYLPIVAIVASPVSPLWRYKLLLGITNSADCLAYIVCLHLLWPNRSGQYLLLAGPNYSGMDELDEFNEAPHVVNNCSINSTVPHHQNGGMMVTGSQNGPTHQKKLRKSTSLIDDDDEDEEIATFDRQRFENQRRHSNNGNHQNGSKRVMMMMNEGALDEDEDSFEAADDDYEHISLAIEDDDDVYEKGEREIEERGRRSGEISTDLLNCDDNDNVVLSTDDLLMADPRPIIPVNPNATHSGTTSDYNSVSNNSHNILNSSQNNANSSIRNSGSSLRRSSDNFLR